MKVASARWAADKMKARVFPDAGRESPMRALTVLLMLVAAGSAQARGKTKGSRHAPATRSTPAETTAPAAEAAAPVPAEPQPEKTEKSERAAGQKTPKAKVYTFNGLDVEGKLKTPQLLFFLNRVKLELDTTGREKRSFLKELENSSDDRGL
jgi:hypothetical protein